MNTQALFLLHQYCYSSQRKSYGDGRVAKQMVDTTENITADLHTGALVFYGPCLLGEGVSVIQHSVEA